MAGLVPAFHGRLEPGVVDARAFAAPKGLRPRRRDEPGHDDAVTGARYPFPTCFAMTGK